MRRMLEYIMQKKEEYIKVRCMKKLLREFNQVM